MCGGPVGVLFLFSRQKNGQHGFLHVQAILGFVKDLRCVLLEHRRGNLLTPVGGQAVLHHAAGICRRHQLLIDLVAGKGLLPARLFFLLAHGGPHVSDHTAVATTSAS